MMENVLLISLDCVRPEALSCYPDAFDDLLTFPHSAETPNIDSIADESLVFTNAFTQAPFTPASHASIFTGTNPYRHGIRSMFGCRLRDEVPTMAEVFRDSGYKTAGFIGAHALSTEYGLDRGFETYGDEFQESSPNWIVGNRRPGSEVTNEALQWLDQTEEGWFLFVHYFDVHDGADVGNDNSREAGDDQGTEEHTDSTLSSIYNRVFRKVDDATGGVGRKLYKSWVDLRDESPQGRRYHLTQTQHVDEQIGQIVDKLKSDGEYDDTTIVLFADHGDAFGEHGEYGHREFLYDTTLRVPLIIKPPRATGVDRGAYDDVVRLIDIFPTVAGLTGVESPQSHGTDVLQVAEKGESERSAYAETRSEESPMELEQPTTDYISLRTRKWKLIVDCVSGDRELYDVESNPEETRNLIGERPEIGADLKQQLDSLISESPRKIEDIDTSRSRPSVVSQLEGLGYL